jgi:hypothetical protein
VPPPFVRAAGEAVSDVDTTARQQTCLVDNRVVTGSSVIPKHILDLERLFVSGVDSIKLLVVRKDGAVDGAAQRD